MGLGLVTLKVCLVLDHWTSSLWLFGAFCGSIQMLALVVLICGEVVGILIEFPLNLEAALGSMDILTVFVLLTHEHGMCFHLFVSSSNSFISVL